MAFIYDLTDTWNAGGTTFNAIRMNVTDTASAAASKLITLQVGGSERFGVDKAGIGTFSSVVRAAGGSATAPAFSFGTDTNTGIFSPAADTLAFAEGGVEVMRITDAGNVGIGTASPERRLHVVSNQPLRMGTATDWFQFTQTNTNVWGWLSSSSVYPMVMNGSTGDVGFGTLSPSGKVHVVNSYSNTSDVTIIAEGNIPGINIRATAGGRFSILTNFGASNTTSILLGTGTNNPSERIRFDHASGAVILGTGAPNAAAQLQVDSTTRGFLPPRMSTGQRDAIATPPDGLMLYNSTTNKLQVRAAGAWVDLH
jgi:hypothetical protein